MTAVDANAPSARPIGRADIAISIFVAFNLAVAQPLLDLLGRNPTFFVARRAPITDIVLLALLFTFIIPGVAVLIALAARRMNKRLGLIVHGIGLGLLLSLLALQVLKHISGVRDWPWAPLFVIAGLLGAALLVVYHRAPGLRTITRFLAPIPVAVAALFLLFSPVHTLIMQRSSFSLVDKASITKPAPVIMVVFDEFPIASLMDADGNIDRRLYPNFAALADRSTWFRNATTAHDFTEKAVPAILTGSFTTPGELPTAEDHPDSIFRLLAGSYDMRAHESLTQLCPPATCKQSTTQSFTTRWRSLLSDVELLYEHQALPTSFEKTRPRVDQTWGNFGAASGSNKPTAKHPFGRLPTEDDPLRDFRAFLKSITPDSSRPQFDFIHVLVPHAPWHYLPSEQAYEYPRPLPGLSAKVWTDNPWPVQQAYQRHLLQTGFADSLIGDLIKKLKAVGMFDKAMIVVTADHGVSFQPGTDYRHVVEKTVPDISQVPFFFKRPGQRAGQIVDRPVMTIDVVPTIADVLGVKGLFKTDGHSAFDTSAVWKDRVIYNQGFRALHIGISGNQKLAVVERKLALFGDGERISSLFGIAPAGLEDVIGLAGRGGRAPGASVTIENAETYKNFEANASVLPTYVFGTVRGLSVGESIAIAVNGRVVAATKTYRIANKILYGALTPESAYLEGSNTVTVYLVRGSPGARTLLALS